jgi:hypothetical protein
MVDREDFLGAMVTLAFGAVEVGPVITGTVGLSALATVLTEFASGGTHHAKVLVDPRADLLLCAAAHRRHRHPDGEQADVIVPADLVGANGQHAVAQVVEVDGAADDHLAQALQSRRPRHRGALHEPFGEQQQGRARREHERGVPTGRLCCRPQWRARIHGEERAVAPTAVEEERGTAAGAGVRHVAGRRLEPHV